MTTTPSALVVDTNVVLDWLVFRDPSIAALEPALARGSLHWFGTAAMRNELEHVLTYEPLSAWPHEPLAVLSAWDGWVHQVEPAQPSPADSLRCTDPDDQKFIDLALQLGRCTLLSRDRALLRLARRASVRGVTILAPRHWHP